MKKLIINPTKPERSQIKMLPRPEEAVEHLLEKVFRKTVDQLDEGPTPVTVDCVNRFVGHVQMKAVPASRYAGATVSSSQEAINFMDSMGNEIYGTPMWFANLYRGEIEANIRSNHEVYGLEIPQEAVKEALKVLGYPSTDLYTVEVREAPVVTKQEIKKKK